MNIMNYVVTDRLIELIQFALLTECYNHLLHSKVVWVAKQLIFIKPLVICWNTPQTSFAPLCESSLMLLWSATPRLVTVGVGVTLWQ